MSYIKFENDETVYQGEIQRLLSCNVIRVSLSEEDVVVNDSGFKVYEDEELTKLIGDFSGFTTIFDADNFILSNNGMYLGKEPDTIVPTSDTMISEPDRSE